MFKKSSISYIYDPLLNAYLINKSLLMVPLFLLHNEDNNSYNLAVLSLFYTVSCFNIH